MPIYRIEAIRNDGVAVTRYAADAVEVGTIRDELLEDPAIDERSVATTRRLLPRTKRELVELLEAWA